MRKLEDICLPFRGSTLRFSPEIQIVPFSFLPCRLCFAYSFLFPLPVHLGYADMLTKPGTMSYAPVSKTALLQNISQSGVLPLLSARFGIYAFCCRNCPG